MKKLIVMAIAAAAAAVARQKFAGQPNQAADNWQYATDSVSKPN